MRQWKQYTHGRNIFGCAIIFMPPILTKNAQTDVYSNYCVYMQKTLQLLQTLQIGIQTGFFVSMYVEHIRCFTIQPRCLILVKFLQICTFWNVHIFINNNAISFIKTVMETSVDAFSIMYIIIACLCRNYFPMNMEIYYFL